MLETITHLASALSSATGSFKIQGWLETFLSHFHLHKICDKMNAIVTVKLCSQSRFVSNSAPVNDLQESLFWLKTAHISSLKDYGNNFLQLFSICFYLKVQLVLLTDE